MSALIRNLQIDLVLDNPNENIIIFNSICDKLIMIEESVYHRDGGEYIYYIVSEEGEKECVFYRDDNKKFFWCSNEKYWSFFSSKHNIYYTEIQILTKILVEKILDVRLPTPTPAEFLNGKVVEALQSSLATPIPVKKIQDRWINNALNNINSN